MHNLIQLYTEWKGCVPKHTESLPKAGSNRHYVRLTDNEGRTVIGVVGADTHENRCFINLSRHFHEKGLPVPEILAVSTDETCYLQTDLGGVSLYQAISHGRENNGAYEEAEVELLKRTIRLLPHLQVEGAQGLNFDSLLSPTYFDRRTALFDLHYFKYCFLRTTDLPLDETRLENDFEQLADDLVKSAMGECTFMYRDFQARNVMLVGKERKPYFIDFQGGKCGPLQYDVASFLWQASAHYSSELRQLLVNEYVAELSTLININPENFKQDLQRFVLFRLLQVLGAYGLRGRFERKQYFIDSIPPALQSISCLLEEGVAAPYPYLHKVLTQLIKREGTIVATPKPSETSKKDMPADTSDAHKQTLKEENNKKLKVRVFSFSYKRGIPEDTSGNGGGYVFDCRSTHNPGRYEPYKQLTGLDEPVIRFLEDDGEILLFLQSVYRLAETHVERYLQRGFTDLMFCFGCTGGQHRSVYSAQHLAEHLHRKYNIEVSICHREQNIQQTLTAK